MAQEAIAREKLKTINLKGKDYTEVKDRLLALAEHYPGQYSIDTDYDFIETMKMFITKTTLRIWYTKEDYQVYTGLAHEVISDNVRAVNFTKALENCETSSVGRALAMAGIGIDNAIASATEISLAMARKEVRLEEAKEEAVAEKKSMSTLLDWTAKVQGTADMDSINTLLGTYLELDLPADSQVKKKIGAAIMAKGTALGLTYNKEAKQFSAK